MIPQQHATRALATAVLAVATLVAASGCSVGAEPSPSPTPTAAFASEEEAFAAAEEVYRAYIEASNRVDLRDPATFEGLSEFTTGRYEANERKELTELHALGYVSAGDIVVEWIEGLSLSAENEVRMLACNDVSSTTLVDADGVSLVASDRPPRYALRLYFVTSDGAVQISDSEAIEDQKCASGLRQ